MKKTFTTTRLVRSTYALLFALFFAGSLFGQATLSVQGVLKKSDGTAVEDKTHNVTFALYKSQGGNDKVWDGIIETETRGGIFNVVLGAPPGPALTAPFDVIYYLGVRVEGGQELQPRPQLTHAPYAMGLIGQNNVFPSTGTVKADGIVVPGGAPNTGVAGKGYSFGTGGDQDGGLFSTGSDNVGLYANATKALEASPSGVTIPGTLSVGNTTVNGNETVTGSSRTNGKVVTSFLNAGGGYSFIDDGGFDSGLFGVAEGDIDLRVNGNSKVRITPDDVTVNGKTTVTGTLFLKSVDFFDKRNMQIDDDGEVGYDNSSRRYKYNIQPLKDDFLLILQSQRKTYTRKGDSNRWELGYIAEEMDSIGLKKLVEYDKDGNPDGYNYEKMILYVTEVLKIQHAEIEKLQAEIVVLKTENAQLQTSNAALKAKQDMQEGFHERLRALESRIGSGTLPGSN